MGWTSEPCSKPATAKDQGNLVLERFLAGWNQTPKVLGSKHTAEDMGNQVLYALLELEKKDGSRTNAIFVILYHWRDGELYTKEMDSSVGPCYYDCPVKWFDAAPVVSDFDREWREECLKRDALKREMRRLKAGDLVRFSWGYAGHRVWRYTGMRGVFTLPDGTASVRLRNWRKNYAGLATEDDARQEVKP